MELLFCVLVVCRRHSFALTCIHINFYVFSFKRCLSWVSYVYRSPRSLALAHAFHVRHSLHTRSSTASAHTSICSNKFPRWTCRRRRHHTAATSILNKTLNRHIGMKTHINIRYIGTWTYIHINTWMCRRWSARRIRVRMWRSLSAIVSWAHRPRTTSIQSATEE